MSKILKAQIEASPTISSLLVGRNNNFNLLRLVAALTVFAAHVLLLRQGLGEKPSLVEQYLGTSASSLAVNAFFVLSGLLVTKSLLRSQSVAEYVIARGLRLLPGFMVLTLVLTFGIGLTYTVLEPTEYLFSGQTLQYWFFTSLTLSEAGALPGLFLSNPVATIVNGPIWTLKYEVFAYASILVLFAFGILRRKGIFTIFFCMFLLVSIFAVQTLDIHAAAHTLNGNPLANLFRFGTCFLFGTLCYVLRDNMRLNGFAVLVAFGAAYLLRGYHLFEIAAIIALGYAIIWLALVPSGKVRKFNQLGDYSYGIYIWHWPIIQTLLVLNPNLSNTALFALALGLTLSAAVASWHFIERPALNSRHRAVACWRRLSASAGRSKLPIKTHSGHPQR